MDFDKGPDLRLVWPDVPQDRAVLTHVLDLIAPGYGLYALEFGVASGETLAMIADVLPVIGFDSFNGLPEHWRENFHAGMFAGVRPDGPIANATIEEGEFANTLPGYPWPEPVGLVHIDCDLYSSTKTVLDELAFSDLRLGGTYFVFDEMFGYEGWEQHEWRAFSEFIDLTGYKYEVVGHGREQLAVYLP